MLHCVQHDTGSVPVTQPAGELAESGPRGMSSSQDETPRRRRLRISHFPCYWAEPAERMLERRPALGTEDITRTDAGVTDRAALVVRDPRRRSDGPGRGWLGPGGRLAAGRGAPGRPHRLVALGAGPFLDGVPGSLDLIRPVVTIVDQCGLTVSRPGLRLGVRRSNGEGRGCLDALSEAARARHWFSIRLVLSGFAVICHPHRALPRRHASGERPFILPWLTSGS